MSYISSALLKIATHLLFHLIFLKIVNHLYWLKYRIVKKAKMLPKIFLKKFEVFTNQSYRIAIKWITKKVKYLFKVKSKNPTCVISRGKCSFGEEYIGETERNEQKRWSEHNNPTQKTNPWRHSSNNIGYLLLVCTSSTQL